jgi:uncharacterized membrane protein
MAEIMAPLRGLKNPLPLWRQFIAQAFKRRPSASAAKEPSCPTKKSGIQSAGRESGDTASSFPVFYAGDLPHPSVLRGYEDVVPGAGERIIAMAEKRSAHRQRMESSELKIEGAKCFIGLLLAFFIVLAAFATGAYTALHGKPFLGSMLSLASLAAVIGPFIYQRRRERAQEGSRQ